MQGNGKRDVVISGMGVVSPIGTGTHAFTRSLQQGRSGIRRISLFDASTLTTRFAGEADGFEPDELLAGHDILTQTRERRILMACSAAALALQNAGLEHNEFAGRRAAVVLGTGVQPSVVDINLLMHYGIYQDLIRDEHPDPHRADQAIARETSGENRSYPIYNRANGGAQAVARLCGIRGPCHAVISACAAATQAMGLAKAMIERGEADVVITGGYDSMIFHFGLYAFCLLGLMSTRNDNPAGAMKPFDKQRDGFALGEGAGVLVFEDKQRALQRGACVYAEVAGYGASVDSYKITDPHPHGTGAILAMRSALTDAGMQPADIAYINAHGTATPKNDRIETAAIKNVFGPNAARIPVSSTKSMIGHLMAAGGALELIATVLGMQHTFIPPTINYSEPDPDCDLDYVPNAARSAAIPVALSNSFGLGGQNASIIVRHPEASPRPTVLKNAAAGKRA